MTKIIQFFTTNKWNYFYIILVAPIKTWDFFTLFNACSTYINLIRYEKKNHNIYKLIDVFYSIRQTNIKVDPAAKQINFLFLLHCFEWVENQFSLIIHLNRFIFKASKKKKEKLMKKNTLKLLNSDDATFLKSKINVIKIYVTYTLKNKIPITANISWIPVQEKSMNNCNFAVIMTPNGPHWDVLKVEVDYQIEYA
ncbi:hypothetical protein AGLY_007767 [Aphis glycines]|uniref:Uncharacterized protein n=1 Tax=Aphis glycines TaxID=307491 RepID=A0A6G0TQ75_APHGL|nr:hypothetical protein AGLY_007767 [Aphis glycines]